MARLGIVLGAGGSRGYGWHTGVLRGLEEITGQDLRGTQPMVGTSAGSYAAAYLRGGFTGADLFASAIGEPPTVNGLALSARIGATGQLASVGRPAFRPAAPSVVVHAVRDRRLPRVGALLAGLLPAGTVSGEPWLAPLRLLWEDRDWPAGLRIPAVRVRDGVRVVFDHTNGVPVPDAVAASSAVPAYMAPIVIGGETYVDGSAHAPTNADLLGDEPLDLVVISAPMSAPPEGGGLGRDSAVRVWATRHARGETARLARAGVRVVTIAPNDTARVILGHRMGSVDERRAAAARAAYAQVLASSEALAAALN